MSDPTPDDPSRPQQAALISFPSREHPNAPLPIPLTSFVGREREIERIGALLRRAEVRLVTLTGPGGVGKTRLAIAAATGLVDAFGGALHFVALAPVTDATLVGSAVAQALGVRSSGERPLPAQLGAALGTRRRLVLLDNLEQVLDAAPLLAEILVACPGLTLLVTSREPLHLSGEWEFPVPPLSLPTRGTWDVGREIDDGTHVPRPTSYVSEAVALFAQRAGAVQPDFALTAENGPSVVELCVRLDGLPLAIELAAARVKVFSPGALLARLDRRLEVLIGGPRDAPPRLRTLRDAIAWSHDLLSPSEQALFRRLAVFSGGFTLDAAEAVAGGEEKVLSPSVLDGIASLVDKSLLRPEERGEHEARFGMLETVREFAWERLAASGEETATRRLHAAFYLTLAERVTDEDWGPRYVAAMDRLETERENLRAALGWAVEQRDAELGLRLGQELHFFWRVRGPVGEGRDWLERVLALGPRDHDRLWIDNLMHAGDLALVHGDRDEAVALLDTALALARDLDDPVALAYALINRGVTALGCDQDELARALWEEALPLFRAQDDDGHVAVILDNLGTIARRRGKPTRALALHEQALALSRARHIVWLEANILGHVAGAATDLGDYERAAALYRESLGLVWESGDRRLFAGILAGFAGLVAACGQPERSARLCGAVAGLVEAVGATLSPAGRTSFERAEAAARTGLEAAAFAAAWAEGRAMAPPQMLGEAETAVPLVPVPSKVRVPASDRRGGPGASAGLTAREREVLGLLAGGRSNKQIGEALFISPETVRRHLTNIYTKLGVASRGEASAFAHRHGFV